MAEGEGFRRVAALADCAAALLFGVGAVFAAYLAGLAILRNDGPAMWTAVAALAVGKIGTANMIRAERLTRPRTPPDSQ